MLRKAHSIDLPLSVWICLLSVLLTDVRQKSHMIAKKEGKKKTENLSLDSFNSVEQKFSSNMKPSVPKHLRSRMAKSITIGCNHGATCLALDWNLNVSSHKGRYRLSRACEGLLPEFVRTQRCRTPPQYEYAIIPLLSGQVNLPQIVIFIRCPQDPWLSFLMHFYSFS